MSNSGEEQPVKRAKPSYALADTHTTILPLKFYFCVKTLNQYATEFVITTNTIYDPIATDVAAVTPTGSNPRTWYTGAYSYGGNMWNPDNNLTSSNNQTERFFYRDYFSKFYKHYHVISTEMSLTVQNQGPYGINVGMLRYSDETAPPTSTSTTNGTGITIPLFDAWKHTKRLHIPGGSNSQHHTLFRSRKTITETFSNGTAPVEALELHDIANNKVQSQVWSQVNSAPLHREYIKLYLWNDPLQHWDNGGGVNFELNLKCLVQFRDLKKFLEYPTGSFANYPITSEAGTIVVDGEAGNNFIQ